MLSTLQQRARKLKDETATLIVAWDDPRTPWAARVLLVLVIAYALSPIDLIPDFVPVLGYLDDLLLLPLGIALALTLIPPTVLADSRARLQSQGADPNDRAGRAAAAVIVLLWVAALGGVIRWGWRWWATR